MVLLFRHGEWDLGSRNDRMDKDGICVYYPVRSILDVKYAVWAEERPTYLSALILVLLYMDTLISVIILIRPQRGSLS